MRWRREQADLALFAALFALLAAGCTRWPDDWDGIGFLSSVRTFDLDTFSPHPPGYPVYVALLRVAAWLAPSPMFAADAVAVASGIVTAVAMARAMRAWSPSSSRMAVAVAAAGVVACPLVWRSFTGVGSEAPALACAALAAWGIARRDRAGAALAGVALGLGLGVRVSWAPLYLPLLVVGERALRRRTLGAALASTLAWGLPFVAIVGPAHLLALSRVHLIGHASRWGGTAWTEPARARFLLRDVFVDGLGIEADALGAIAFALLAASVVLAVLAWKRAGFSGARTAALVAVPYLVWISVGQNLRQQPRHALPLVVLLAAALAAAALRDRHARLVVAALAAAVALRASTDSRARQRTPPAAVQMIEWIRSLPDAARVAVFAGPSERYFEETDIAAQAHSAALLGDVIVGLGRLNDLPARVLVTGEIDDVRESPYPTTSLATFCRPARIDRRAPCLTVYDVALPFLPPR